jgi:hypothetical protein
MNANPFASFDLYLPNVYKEKIDKFTKSSGRQEGTLISPFPRQIDFWFTAFLYGVSKNLTPVEEKDSYKFIQGSILTTDPHRISVIQLVALGRTGDPAVLTEPKQMLDLASGLAFAATPQLIGTLDDPDEDKPLWALLNMYEIISKPLAPAT